MSVNVYNGLPTGNMYGYASYLEIIKTGVKKINKNKDWHPGHESYRCDTEKEPLILSFFAKPNILFIINIH